MSLAARVRKPITVGRTVSSPFIIMVQSILRIMGPPSIRPKSPVLPAMTCGTKSKRLLQMTGLRDLGANTANYYVLRNADARDSHRSLIYYQPQRRREITRSGLPLAGRLLYLPGSGRPHGKISSYRKEDGYLALRDPSSFFNIFFLARRIKTGFFRFMSNVYVNHFLSFGGVCRSCLIRGEWLFPYCSWRSFSAAVVCPNHICPAKIWVHYTFEFSGQKHPPDKSNLQ